MINLTSTDYEFCHPDLAEDWIKVEASRTEDGNRIGQLIGYIRLPHKMKHPEAYRAVRKKTSMEKKQTAVEWLI
jgi:hypothetical protein